MITLSFDGTFEGLLTLVFESYRMQLKPDAIVNRVRELPTLFDQAVFIPTEEEKANRVWHRIKQKTSKTAAYQLVMVFESELPQAPTLIYRFIQHMVDSNYNIETDFANPVVVEVSKICRKVLREAHHVQMFTRFQQTAVDSYYASFVPKYNVLPLSIAHFRDRYADMEWVIYDLQRNFGYHHLKGAVQRITFEELPVNESNGFLEDHLLHPEEKHFQALWKEYYQSISIVDRKNYKLHRQKLPKRFWRYLPEKQV